MRASIAFAFLPFLASASPNVIAGNHIFAAMSQDPPPTTTPLSYTNVPVEFTSTTTVTTNSTGSSSLPIHTPPLPPTAGPGPTGGNYSSSLSLTTTTSSIVTVGSPTVVTITSNANPPAQSTLTNIVTIIGGAPTSEVASLPTTTAGTQSGSGRVIDGMGSWMVIALGAVGGSMLVFA